MDKLSSNASEEWRRLEEEIAACKRCPLHLSRHRPVPGEGKKDADVMLVGEAPGRVEDETGRPFVGPAGKLLNQLLELAGLDRSSVYITNIVKCRPPGNRDPTDEEIEKCLPYLVRQVRLVKPRIIVAVGRHAARTLFREAGLKWRSMKEAHGKPVDAVLWGLNVTLFPVFHPAAALYNPGLRGVVEGDFKRLKGIIPGSRRNLLDYL